MNPIESRAPGVTRAPFIHAGRSWGETGRFIFAATLCLFAAPAIAEPRVTLQLGADQVAEIMRLVDRQPAAESPPSAYWTLQAAIEQALKNNPDATRAFLKARSAR